MDYVAKENVSENTVEGAPSEGWSTLQCMFHTSSSLAAIYIVGSLAAFIFGGLLTWCILFRTGLFSTSKDDKNRLFSIIQTYLWDYEDKIDSLLCTLDRLHQRTLNGSASEHHLFAYNLRHSLGAFQRRFSITERVDEIHVHSVQNLLFTIKHIERFVEAVLLHIPPRGRAPMQIQSTIGPYIQKLFRTTALLWDDKKTPKVRKVLTYFIPPSELCQIDGLFLSDKELDCIIESQVPYHTKLSLVKNVFVLHQIEVSKNDTVNLGSKMRFVDTFLAHGYISHEKVKAVSDWLKGARDICVIYDLACYPKNSNKNYTNHTHDEGKQMNFAEKLVALRHLFRLMCMDSNVSKLEKEDRFFQFLMQLYEPMYGWADLRFKSEVLERTRGDIFVCLKMLEPDLMMCDKEASRSKLEKVERDLCSLLAYLTLKRDQVAQMSAYREKCGSKEVSKDDLLKSRSLQTDSRDSLLDPESQPLLSRGRTRSAENLGRSVLEQMHQQSSITSDQGSWVSGSSMYATAMSACSGDSIAHRMSPPAHIAMVRREFLQGAALQMEPDYDETAV